MERGLTGRERELADVAGFLDGLGGALSALVFTGEAGIGKTALWLEAVRLAEVRSLVVLSARPVVAEAGLAYAGLADLLEKVPDDVLSGLPEPQRRALAVALLREDPGDHRFDRRAVGAATLGVITALAREAPVVIAVDDVQWLDHPSAHVLGFAMRRLRSVRAGLLASERTVPQGTPWAAVNGALPAERVRHLEVEPLSQEETRELIVRRLGQRMTRRTLARVGQVSGGNPFFALEIARSLAGGQSAAPAVLRLPESLRSLAGERVASLPAHARDALLAVSVLRSPTVELVGGGIGEPVGRTREWAGGCRGSRRGRTRQAGCPVHSSAVRGSRVLVGWSGGPAAGAPAAGAAAGALCPSQIAGSLMRHEGRMGRACDLLGGLRQRLIDRGEESNLPGTVMDLGWAECLRGNLSAAATYAREAIEVATRIGMESTLCWVHGQAAEVAAYRGEAEEARRLAGAAIDRAFALGQPVASFMARDALAVLALSLSDYRAAGDALEPLTGLLEGKGLTESTRAMFLSHPIEVLIGLGELGRARPLLGMLEGAAELHNWDWARLEAGRCRALLCAAEGDLAAANEAAAAAVRLGESLEFRLEFARTLLAAGEIERRGKRKRAAREFLERAVQIFHTSGAVLWEQRARGELDRAAARPAGDELTASEERVACLAASGLTNREVAAQLFMSPKTVEANLARVYRKLRIRSRAELGARVAQPARPFDPPGP